MSNFAILLSLRLPRFNKKLKPSQSSFVQENAKASQAKSLALSALLVLAVAISDPSLFLRLFATQLKVKILAKE
jgi:hypothetical protein